MLKKYTFFINHILKYKYQSIRLKINVFGGARIYK